MKTEPRTCIEDPGQFKDLCDFIEFCKIHGVNHFKKGDVEFSFSQTFGDSSYRDYSVPMMFGTGLVPAGPISVGASSTATSTEAKEEVTEDMPSADELLFASSETTQWEGK